MGERTGTLKFIKLAQAIQTNLRPMTIRQVYRQLIAMQLIDNNRGLYRAVSNALADAWEKGVIPWKWIEDRRRRPRKGAYDLG